MDIHLGALEHGIAVDDIEHAVGNAMAVDDIDDDLCLCLGPARTRSMLEIVTVLREGDPKELVIHAMAMQGKHRRLLPGG